MTLLGLGVMSVAMLLAVRPAWLEHRLHKWLVGAAIRTDLCGQGLPAARFRQERFEMR